MKSQRLRLAIPSFLFSFFFMRADYTVQETLCTVHGTYNHFIQKKKNIYIYILKIGPMILFTYLKIILL